MITGLIIGKFYPLHAGHIGLIEFAEKNCDLLYVLICASDKEAIQGEKRLQWLEETFKNKLNIKPVLLNYSEKGLPNTSVSSEDVSKIWASKISTIFTGINIIFSSEPYGEYLAHALKCKSISYDPDRTTVSISATEIRQNPFKFWEYIAASAKPYFVKKICITGTESTGKSTLTENLAAYYKTAFVPEMAREIIEETDDCTELHLKEIAELHAKTINEKILTANKLLFVDTDLNITRSYSQFLFHKKLVVPDWIEQANTFDLYLYLENDSPYIQDGTRLDKERRDKLDGYHKKELIDREINFELISGNWEERFQKAVAIIDRLLLHI
ncbi:MAG: AAA family ATPase [Lacibacter sp.]